MATPLDILLRLDAKQARRELIETTGDVKTLTNAAISMDQETGKSATALTALAGSADASGASLAKAATEMSSLAASSGRASTAMAASLDTTAKSTKGLFSAVGGGQMAARQFAFQLNQVAQQGAVTGNYMQALSIQAADMLTVFGLWGILAGGIIAVMGPVAMSLFSAEERANALTSTIEELQASTKDLGAAMAEAKRGIYDLRTEFGDGADAARQMNIALLELTRLRTEQDLRAAIEGIGDAIDDLSSFGVTKVSRVANEFNLTEESAYRVAAAMQKFSMADTMDQQVTAARNLVQAFSDAEYAAGGASNEAFSLAENAAKAALKALELGNQTEAAKRIAEALAGVDLGQPFRDANAAAATLVGTIASINLSNIGKAAQLAALQSGSSQSAAEVAGKVAERRAELADKLSSPDAAVRSGAEGLVSSYEAGLSQDAALSDQISEIVKARAAASRASGSAAKSEASETKKAAEAVRDLITSQQTELNILRETDPVQREMLRHREALAAATPKQRSELEGLITVYQAEKERMDEIKAASEDMRSTMENSFTGLISGADSFGDALSRVLDKIAEMAASSAFDMLWDAGGGGGLFDGFFSWLIPGKADGGQVIGAGGPREDNLLHWLSNGEFVVNAASTSQYLPLLEAINAGMSPRELMPAMLGRVPRLADGGRVGVISAPRLPSLSGTSASAGPTTPGGTIVLQATINLAGARGDREIEQAAAAGMQSAIAQAIDHYDRLILPQRVQEISDDPRSIG